MYLSYDHRLVYFATPRTASQATSHLLRELGFSKIGGHHAGWDPVLPLSMVTCMTTVRHPLDWLVSVYTKKHSGWGHLPFTEFLRAFAKDPNYGAQPKNLYPHARWIHENLGRMRDGIILHYEALEWELANVLEKRGLGYKRIPYYDQYESDRKDYRTYYSAADLDFAMETWAHDITMYGYKRIDAMPARSRHNINRIKNYGNDQSD